MPTIFITDLDGTLLGHDDFGFAVIRDDFLAFLAAGVPIIPRSIRRARKWSISVTGSASGCRSSVKTARRSSMPIFSRRSSKGHAALHCRWPSGRGLMSDWIAAIDPGARVAVFLDALDAPQQSAILGLSGDDLERALACGRFCSVSRAMTANLPPCAPRRRLPVCASIAGRVCCLSGQHDKSTFSSLIRASHGSGSCVSSIIGFGDSENDVAMLCSVDIACVVPRPGATPLHLPDPPETVIIAPQPAPEGWVIAANEAVMAVQQRRDLGHG